MSWILIAAAAVLVVVIAVVAIGRVSAQLAVAPGTSVYDLADAVDFVVERLPDTLTAKLSHDDVEQILRWRLNHLRAEGLATTGDADEVAALARRGVHIADEETAIDDVMADVRGSQRDIDEVDVVVVLDLETDYLRAIGAVGPPTDGPAQGR